MRKWCSDNRNRYMRGRVGSVAEAERDRHIVSWDIEGSLEWAATVFASTRVLAGMRRPHTDEPT